MDVEQSISPIRRVLCFPIYVAMIGGGAFLIYEKLEGLRFRFLALTGAVLLVMGVYLFWTDILSLLFRRTS